MPSTAGNRPRRERAGFTLVELMVALTVLLIGVAGIMAMYSSSMKATAYNRHATEAVALGEDKMEELRTLPLSSFAACNPCTDTVNARGQPAASGDFPFTRTWQVVDPTGGAIPPPDPTVRNLEVVVSWTERGETVELAFRTQRAP